MAALASAASVGSSDEALACRWPPGTSGSAIVTVGGERYDCGSKSGFLEATVNMALKDPELAQQMRDIAQGIVSAS